MQNTGLKKHKGFGGWLGDITIGHVMKGGVDIPFLIIVLCILFFGLVMLASASYAYALAYKGNSYHFILRQSIWAAVGLVGMIVASVIDYRIYRYLAVPLWGLSLIMLVWALLIPTQNAHRWIYIGGFQFQPSEIAKFSLVLLFSQILSRYYQEKYHGFWGGSKLFLFCGMILGLTAVLLVKEPHISCTIIVCLMCGVLFVAGGIRARWILIIVAVGVVGIAYIILSGKISYSGDRVGVWLDPFGYADRDASHQTRQSLYAIGSGGLFGLGLGESRQKYLYLPEPQNDFIFAIVCEELGFVGALFVMLLFGLLVWRGIVISLRAPDRFGMLCGLGLTVQVGIQALLNMAVVTNSIPNTGISLPFFSYGGTSLMMLLTQMGVVLSISRTSHMPKLDRPKAPRTR